MRLTIIVTLMFIALPCNLLAEPAAPPDRAEAEQAILQRLERRVDLSVEKAPLEVVVEWLAKKADTPIELDKAALEDSGLKETASVTLELKGVPIRTVLAQLAFQLDLEWVIRNDVVVVTSPDEAVDSFTVRTYPIGDWLEAGGDASDQADDLIDLITASTLSTTWDTVGGPAGITATGESLVVSHHPRGHLAIASLLENLRQSRASREKWSGRDHQIPDLPASGAWHEANRWEGEWEKIRRQKVTLEFQETPLSEVVRVLSQKSGLPFQLDTRESNHQAFDPARKITFSCEELPWESALDRLLHSRDFAKPEIDHWTLAFFHGSILIANGEDADLHPTWVFPAFDLVHEPAPYDLQRAAPSGMGEDDLTDTITALIEPTRWDTVGGPASIQYYSPAGCLVVTASRETQVKVADLLARLRKDGKVAPKRVRAELDATIVTRVYGPYSDAPDPPAAPPPAAKPEPAPAKAPDPAPKPNDGLEKKPLGYFGAAPAFVGIPQPRARIKAAEVAEAIRLIVEPESWEKPETGARLITLGDRLIIRHQVRVHEKIERVVNGLLYPGNPQK